MRRVHRAGEKLFVDFSRKRPHLVDPTTGEEVAVELFVGVLGASSLIYAEAIRRTMDHFQDTVDRALAAIDRSDAHVRFVVSGTGDEDEDE